MIKKKNYKESKQREKDRTNFFYYKVAKAIQFGGIQ